MYLIATKPSQEKRKINLIGKIKYENLKIDIQTKPQQTLNTYIPK